MAVGVKISQLPVATSLTGLELAVVVQEGETRQTTVGAFSSDVSSRIDAVSASLSALDTRVGLVSARTSVNAAAITSINAVVSLKAFRTGDYLDAVQYIEFDTSTVVPSSVGRLSWNLDDGTLNLGLIGGNVVNQLGQELVQRCYNNTGAPIAEGSVVKVVGATGQRLTIELAQANNDANSLTVIGVATETIPNKALGYVATEGFVRSVNTQGFSDGDVLWLSPTIPGKLTNVKPVAPQHMVMIGYVVKGGSVGAGSIFVKVQNGYELGELHDVKVSASTSLANNEVLAYNTSAGVWTNSTLLIDVQNSISALTDRVAAVSAATSVNAATVSALEIRVSDVSARASANAAAITSVNNVVSALEIRIGAVSARASANTAAITSINNVVSALEIRASAVSAAAVSINNVVSTLEIRVSAVSARASINAASIVSINNVVSALEIRVSNVSTAVSVLQQQVLTLNLSAVNARLDTVSAATSANAAAITSVNGVVSALEIRVSDVSAATVSVGQTVSALEVRVSSVSAAAVANAAAIVSVNNVVSALADRAAATSATVSALVITVEAVSARTSINAAAIASVNNVVSALEIRVSSVSAAVVAASAAITSVNAVVSLKVNRSGDTMTGNLTVPSINSGQIAGLRNRIINGAMAVDQRNAGAAQTFTAGAALAYCVDRWYGYCTGANVTGQRVAGAVANTFRYQFTGAASVTAIGFGHRIEAVNSADLADTTVTLGVDLANSLLTSVTWTAYYANTADTFGTLASPTRTQIATGTFTVTSTVTRYSTQISVPSAATTGIEVVFTVGAQTSGTWTIGNVQIESGSVATPFERRPIGTELALCQRYYTKSYGISVAPGTSSLNGYAALPGLAASNANTKTTIIFPVNMRVAPAISYWDLVGNASRSSSFISNNARTDNVSSASFSLSDIATTGFIFNDAGGVGNAGSGAWTSAAHWTASAEL